MVVGMYVITLPGKKMVRGWKNRKEAGVKGLDIAGADFMADGEALTCRVKEVGRGGWIHLNCPRAIFVPSIANII